MKKIMLTGLKPTGSLTLGNYVGAIKQMKERQDEYVNFLFVADLHAITVPVDKKELHNNIKNFIALYHMGIYAEPVLLDWFVSEFPKHSKSKLDMGKSCIRFKKINDIPYELIGQLASKMTTEDWINKYESAFVKK